ncbi:transposase, partial [mine drainage metagenome]
MVRQTVLPFKLESTDDTITSQAGLVLFGEFLQSLGLKKKIDRAFGKPGSGAGYRASSYVVPLLLMLQGGGRSLCDLRMIARDKGLLGLLGIGEVPSTDAFGRWLRRMGASDTGLSALESVIARVLSVLGKTLRKRWKKAGLS